MLGPVRNLNCPSEYPTILNIADAVQAVRYVLLKWHHVAVVKVQADRLGVKLLGEPTAWAYDLKYTIHFGAVDAVKVHRVLLGAIVYEMDPDSVTLGSPDGRPGNAPIKSPCIVIDARRQLHCLLPVICNYGIFAQGSSVVKDRGAAIAKVAQVFCRVYLRGACPAVSAYRIKHVACRPISAKPVPAADDLFFIPGVTTPSEKIAKVLPTRATAMADASNSFGLNKQTLPRCC